MNELYIAYTIFYNGVYKKKDVWIYKFIVVLNTNAKV